MLISASEEGQSISIGHIGNIVELWERIVERGIKIDLGSDQTSLHNPYQGGYFPADYTYEESVQMMSNNPKEIKKNFKKWFPPNPTNTRLFQ